MVYSRDRVKQSSIHRGKGNLDSDCVGPDRLSYIATQPSGQRPEPGTAFWRKYNCIDGFSSVVFNLQPRVVRTSSGHLMTIAIRSRWLRVGGAVIAALAWGIFFAGPARAGCGDYVTVQGQSTDDMPTQHSFPPRSYEPSPCPCQSPNPAEFPQPCPGCSAPVAPESAAAPVPVHQRDDSAMCVAAGHTTPPVSPAALPDFDRGRVMRPISGIYRPPRF
jgi:hypothetical protein